MNATEIGKLQDYFRNKFGNPGFEVRARPRKNDSAEVYLHDEFIGVLYKDEEDGEGDISYDFSMAILEIDLDE